MLRLLFLIISFGLYNISLLFILKESKMNYDLVFFIITNMLLLLSTLIFYGYFHDEVLALLFSIFLSINNTLLFREIYNLDRHLIIYNIPYLIFSYYFVIMVLKVFLV